MTQKFIYFYYFFCSVFYNLSITQERASAAPGGPSVNSQVQESFFCSMIALQYSRMRHNCLKMSFQSFRVSLHSPQLQLNINEGIRLPGWYQPASQPQQSLPAKSRQPWRAKPSHATAELWGQMAKRVKRKSVTIQGTLYGWAPGGPESEKISRP
jgi:hypothetical protein